VPNLPDDEMPTVLPDDGRDDGRDCGFQKNAICKLLKRSNAWRFISDEPAQALS